MEWSCASLHTFLSWANRHSPCKSSAKHHATDIGEVVGSNLWEWGQKEPVGERPILGSSRSLFVAKLAHFWWVTSFGLLGWAYECWHDLEVVCFGFGPFYSMWLGLDLPGKWAFSPWAHDEWCCALSYRAFWVCCPCYSNMCPSKHVNTKTHGTD
jgi:hypothetical protein